MGEPMTPAGEGWRREGAVEVLITEGCPNMELMGGWVGGELMGPGEPAN